MIRTVFIMNSHGSVLFSDEYESNFQIELVSGFISAIYSFMKNTIFTNELDTLDVGGLRFLFDVHEIEEGKPDLIFVVLCDRTENISHIRPRLEQIKWKFLEIFYAEIKIWSGNSNEMFEKFRPFEREILQKGNLHLLPEVEKEVLKHFQKLYNISEFILGAALLTQSGHVILSFIENHFLENILKTLEGRFHSGFLRVKTLIAQEEDGIIVLIGSKDYITAVLFQIKCPIGMALHYGDNFSKSIMALIEPTQ